MERIGVTGASGFMGSVLLPWLTKEPEREIVALTRTLATRSRSSKAEVQWMQGDLMSYRDCARFVHGLDAIVHLAHTNTPFTSTTDLSGDAATNIIPLANLLQAIRDAGTRPHVVYPSTGGALYRGNGESPFDEESFVEPTTSYGIQKLMAEHYLRLGCQEGFLTATVLRIGNPYGVLLPVERRQGFVGVVLARLLEGLPISIFGDPENVRDYVHIDDVMRIFDSALRHRRDHAVYNVGSGEGRSVREVLELLQEYSGIAADVRYDPPTAESRRLPRWIVLDCSKARDELRWEPRIRFADGLQAMCEDALTPR